MLENQNEIRFIVDTVTEILKADKLDELTEILNSAQIFIEMTGYDNLDGGIYYYSLSLFVDVSTFVKIRDRIQSIETELLEKFKFATRHYENEIITNIKIVPKGKPKIDWTKLDDIISKEQLIKDILFLKNTMISVATGKQKIQNINDQYKNKYILIDKALQKLNFKNPNPYKDLWDWYNEYKSKFSKYRERIAYINEMYDSFVQMLKENEDPDFVNVTVDLTNWHRLERSVNEIKLKLNEAKTEEQFQGVGFLCRDTIITLAQAVFNIEKHPILDGTEVSKTDAKRMLEAYIAKELQSSSNEILRKYAKATLDLANELTHKRTATKKDASLCAAATIALINIIGIIEGRN